MHSVGRYHTDIVCNVFFYDDDSMTLTNGRHRLKLLTLAGCYQAVFLPGHLLIILWSVCIEHRRFMVSFCFVSFSQIIMGRYTL